jgi:hypothetical protein
MQRYARPRRNATVLWTPRGCPVWHRTATGLLDGARGKEGAKFVYVVARFVSTRCRIQQENSFALALDDMVRNDLADCAVGKYVVVDF